jgi:hypothetical protein
MNNNSRIAYNESNSLLLNHAKKFLEVSIKRFPLYLPLKFHYSNFLLEHMSNKREAMKELTSCAKLKPSLD